MSFEFSEHSECSGRSGSSDNKLFVLSQQRYQFLYLLSREILFLDEEVDEAGCRAAEEAILDTAHIVAGVLAMLHQRIEAVLLAYGFAGHKLLLLQYAQEGEHRIVGWLGLGKLLQDLAHRTLPHIPQDIHHLQFGTGQFVRTFHIS